VTFGYEVRYGGAVDNCTLYLLYRYLQDEYQAARHETAVQQGLNSLEMELEQDFEQKAENAAAAGAAGVIIFNQGNTDDRKGLENVMALLPGVMALSILFGTTSMLAVTVTFEKRSRSFDRLLLAPIPLEVLMLAKTSGAIVFGTANAFVPAAMATFLADLSHVAWTVVLPAVVLIAVSSTFLGLFIAVSVSEVFEAQTFSNFFRFMEAAEHAFFRSLGMSITMPGTSPRKYRTVKS